MSTDFQPFNEAPTPPVLVIAFRRPDHPIGIRDRICGAGAIGITSWCFEPVKEYE